MDNPCELVASTDIDESDYFIMRDGQDESRTSCIWKGRDLTSQNLRKGREICYLGI